MGIRKIADLGRILVSPGRQIYGLAVIFSPEALEIPGILRTITDVLAKRGISIHHITGSSPLGGDVYILIFADFTGQNPYEVAREVAKVAHVTDVEVIEPLVPGIVVDTITEMVTIGGERAIIMRKTFYKGLLGSLRKELGASAAAIFFHIGLRAGREAFESHLRMVGKRDRHLLVRVVEALWQVVGFGKLEMVTVDAGRCYARVRVYKNFECELFKGSKEPQGYFTRGIIQGWLEKLLGCELRSKETKCIAVGDSYCEFTFTRG